MAENLGSKDAVLIPSAEVDKMNVMPNREARRFARSLWAIDPQDEFNEQEIVDGTKRNYLTKQIEKGDIVELLVGNGKIRMSWRNDSLVVCWGRKRNQFMVIGLNKIDDYSGIRGEMDPEVEWIKFGKNKNECPIVLKGKSVAGVHGGLFFSRYQEELRMDLYSPNRVDFRKIGEPVIDA